MKYDLELLSCSKSQYSMELSRGLNKNIDLEELKENYVQLVNDYFIHDTILLEFDDLDNMLSVKADKEFYIPNQKELLKYKDDTYFEINKEYNDLLKYIAKNLLDGDEWQASMVVEDIQGYCQIGAKPNEIFDIFNHRDISFDDEKQVNEVLLKIYECTGFKSNNHLVY